MAIETLVDANLFFVHLDSVGDGTGVKEAIGDYSGTPARFRVENQDEHRSMVVGSFTLYIQGPGKFLPDNYAGVPELDPGIRLCVRKDTGIVDLTNGEPIIHTCCLNRLFSDVTYNLNGKQPGDNWVSATWNFRRHGVPLVLQYGESIEVILNDDFSGLTAQRFMIYGFWSAGLLFH